MSANGGFLRHKQPYLAIFAGSVRQVFAGHHFDNLPVLSEELFRVLDIGCLHFNTASSPSAAVRYLKMECVIRRPHVFMDRLMIAAHSVSPRHCVELDILGSQIGLSCGAISKLRRCALPGSRESKSLLKRLAASSRTATRLQASKVPDLSCCRSSSRNISGLALSEYPRSDSFLDQRQGLI
jgi:hypothetical protein